MYLVLKIHKDLKQPAGRPKVLGIVFQPLTIYIDYFLQEIVNKLPCCLKDTSDFLQCIHEIDVAENTWLCTLDVDFVKMLDYRILISHSSWLYLT